MKIRTCFVSNSSTSSFIISVPNYMGFSGKERVNYSMYEDRKRDFEAGIIDEEYFEKYRKKYEMLLALAEKENLYIFDMFMDSDVFVTPDSVVDYLASKLPKMEILEENEY